MAVREITLSEADFLASQRTFYKTKWWLKLTLALGVLVLVLALAAAGLALAYGRPGDVGDLAPLALVGVLFIWAAWSYLGGTPRGSRRYFRQSQFSEPLEYAWDAEAMSLKGPDGFHRWPWSRVLRWSEDRASIILMVTDRSYIPIPKRLFGEPELAELRGYLAGVWRA